MSDNQRLKLIRQRLGYNQTDFAKSLNLSQGAYSDVERGRNSISYSLLGKLVKRYGVNPTYLISGKGEMFSHPYPSLDAPPQQLAADPPAPYGQAQPATLPEAQALPPQEEIRILRALIVDYEGQVKHLQGIVETYKGMITAMRGEATDLRRLKGSMTKQSPEEVEEQLRKLRGEWE